jgi:protocatechuate 3,4-dioxygenase beta subunit
MSRSTIKQRRGPLGALLASIATGAAVLLVTSGIASGSSSSAQYEYGHPAPGQAPAVSGTPQVGQTLTTSNGTWTSGSAITYTYAWGRCDTAGNNCATIAGATGNTYKLTTDDQGHTIRSYVTATNSSGGTQNQSAPTSVVQAAPLPTNSVMNAADVSLPNRLVISGVRYSANPIRARKSPTTMQVHVSDSRGNSVAGALVYVEGLPYSRIANIPEVSTNSTGWATVNLIPGKFFPRTGYVVLFVRARVQGQDPLGGTSTRRLVQVTVAPPNGS